MRTFKDRADAWGRGSPDPGIEAADAIADGRDPITSEEFLRLSAELQNLIIHRQLLRLDRRIP